MKRNTKQPTLVGLEAYARLNLSKPIDSSAVTKATKRLRSPDEILLPTDGQERIHLDQSRSELASNAPSAVSYLAVSTNKLHQKGAIGVLVLVKELDGSIRTIEQFSIFEGHTPNRLFIIAAAAALREAPSELSSHTIVCSAEYVSKYAGYALDQWATNDWVKRDGDPVANRSDWVRLKRELAGKQVTWRRPEAPSDDAEMAAVKAIANLALASSLKCGGQPLLSQMAPKHTDGCSNTQLIDTGAEY